MTKHDIDILTLSHWQPKKCMTENPHTSQRQKMFTVEIENSHSAVSALVEMGIRVGSEITCAWLNYISEWMSGTVLVALI